MILTGQISNGLGLWMYCIVTEFNGKTSCVMNGFFSCQAEAECRAKDREKRLDKYGFKRELIW